MTANPLRWTEKMRAMYGKPPYVPDDIGGVDVLVKKYAELVRQDARRQKVVLVDVHAAFEALERKHGPLTDNLLPDGMHPSSQGHRIIADLLLPHVKTE